MGESMAMYERREFARQVITLPCVIQAEGVRFHSTTIDLSMGGVQLALPSLAKAFLTSPVRAVMIDTLPALSIEVRWSRIGQLGARFTEPHFARPRIAELLRRLEREGRVASLSIDDALGFTQDA